LAFGGNTPSYTTATEEWAFGGLPPSTPAAGYADAITGDFYYNSTTGQFKTVNDGGAPIGTWAASATMNDARGEGASLGIQTSAMYSGGEPAVTANTEIYDGSSWTEVGDLNAARYGIKGAGTTTASIVFMGQIPPGTRSALTETFDGSSWTEVGDLNTGRLQGGSAIQGTTTASLCFSGATSTGESVLTESYNGSSWTELADLPTPSYLSPGGTGTQGAALKFAGGGPGGTALDETVSWNGSSWTDVAEMNTARRQIAGAGSQTSALGFGGESYPSPARKSLTEFWNGTSWTEVADLATAVSEQGGAGSTTAAMSYGGEHPPTTTASEQWNAAEFLIKTVTTS
jgi:hypothetical protein